jgi:hypothetical protein
MKINRILSPQMGGMDLEKYFVANRRFEFWMRSINWNFLSTRAIILIFIILLLLCRIGNQATWIKLVARLEGGI